MSEAANEAWTESELSAWKNIEDPAVREIFRKGAENRTLKFLYVTRTSSVGVCYYVFLEYDWNGYPEDRKMTKIELAAGYRGYGA